MGSADAYSAYLQKHAIRGQLITEALDPQLNTIIAIPAYNESGLTTCLDSLFHCDPPLAPSEVLVLINSAKSSSKETVAANRRSYEEVRAWIKRMKEQQGEEQQGEEQQGEEQQGEEQQGEEQQGEEQQGEEQQGEEQQGEEQQNLREKSRQGKLRFHVVLVEDLPDKHFGAGLARKLVMDEAVRRLARAAELENRDDGQNRAQDKHPESGIIVSLDADTVVRRDYLRAVEEHFKLHPRASGCSISFEHPLSRQEYTRLFSPENFSSEAFEAVANYELHQRYYLLAVRYTDYPYAYHTVGSCFAVQAEAYCRAGGMSRRQAGEDFYFIQKLAMQGGFTECRTTRVYPSPRPSDRVPFGTGPDIARQLDRSIDSDSYRTGPDSGPSGSGSGSDASTDQTDDRSANGTGPDSGPSGSGSGSDASTNQTDDRATNGAGQNSSQLPPYLTYHPELFEHLRKFFALIPKFYLSGSATAVPGNGSEYDPAAVKGGDPPVPPAAPGGDPPAGTEKAAVMEGDPPLLSRYLEESGFWEVLEEIRANTASEGAFRKRFYGKFNMFWILKYLHYAEEHGVEKMEVTAAAGRMLEMWKNCPDSGADNSENAKNAPTREMLLRYRKYNSSTR